MGKKIQVPRYQPPHDEEDSRYMQSFTVDQQEDLRAFFDEFGFVVIRDVLTPEECQATVNEVFTIIEQGTNGKFDRNDINTWSSWPADSIEKYGSPHKPPIFRPQFLRNRQNPNVHAVFATLLGQDNLLVNHDRGCLFRPTKNVPLASGEADVPEWGTKGNVHLDMNPYLWMGDGQLCRQELAKLRYRESREFIFENNQPSQSDGLQLQGVINLLDNLEEDGGFVTIPGFHKHFDEYFRPKLEQNAKNVSPSLNFADNDSLMKLVVRVPMRAGSVVVWDQRMPHGSYPNKSANPRCAQFIKMFPAATVTSQRAVARSNAVRREIESLGDQFQVTPLGRTVFGL